jgi:hypothetical protein
MGPNPSLKAPTRYGSHRLATPGHGRNCPCAASRRLPPPVGLARTLGLMSRTPLFIATRTAIAAVAGRLSLLRKDDWSALYVDPATSEIWTRYPMWDYHGSGPECLRRGTPNLSETLESIEQAEGDAEVAAASYYAVNDLPGGKENLQSLVERLERLMQQDQETFSRKVLLAITWTHADKAFNHRNPAGKSRAEVSADYEHFKSIAARAATLRTLAEQVCGKVTQDSAVFA